MSSYTERMKEEYKELGIRSVALVDFTLTKQFTDLTDDEQHDLKEQLVYMGGYLGVLGLRLSKCGIKTTASEQCTEVSNV